MTARPRAMVIGLDCASPALIFGPLRASMPRLDRLIRRGAHGPMRSVMPPITSPAWACMTSGRDPGELGVYGFRDRREDSYAFDIVDARAIEAPRIWDVAGEAGKTVAVLYVPLTSPPREVRGCMVGGFLGDGSGSTTFPADLAAELEARFGPHEPDVAEYRTEDRDGLLDGLYRTARQHFAVARAMWSERNPELLMMVEMATDRLHHAFWEHLDPTHPEHDPAHRHVRDVRDFYAFIDAQLGALIDGTDEDTTVLVVSDHGARTMRGGFRINEWLRERGWLALREQRSAPVVLEPRMVDWSSTRAWAAGGYYARVFLNVQGREPRGIVPEARVASEVSALIEELSSIETPRARTVQPREIYRAVNGRAPELMVTFDDLAVRALGTVGGPLLETKNDSGPDGCNHDWSGIFVGTGPGLSGRGALDGLSIHDVGPTVLGALAIGTPTGWLGVDRGADR